MSDTKPAAIETDTVQATGLAPASVAELRELLCHVETTFEAEKRSLARQLHGELGSSLTALSMHLTLLRQKLPAGHGLEDRLDKMKDLLQGVTVTTRQIQCGLRPEKLEAFGLKVALADMAEQFQESAHCICRLDLPDEELVYSTAQELTILRMVEEALANVHRHAQATRVDIVLDDTEEAIVLSVRDDGLGMAAERIGAAGSHGLRLLQERAGYLNGTVLVKRLEGGGTLLRVNLPKAAG